GGSRGRGRTPTPAGARRGGGRRGLSRGKTGPPVGPGGPAMIVRKALLVIAFLALLAQPGPAAAPETSGLAGFDTPPVLDAADFLSPGLLKGATHEVDRKVTNDGVSNFYSIRTPYGDFRPAGTS